jgi:hypothetical protein
LFHFLAIAMLLGTFMYELCVDIYFHFFLKNIPRSALCGYVSPTLTV